MDIFEVKHTSKRDQKKYEVMAVKSHSRKKKKPYFFKHSGHWKIQQKYFTSLKISAIYGKTELKQKRKKERWGESLEDEKEISVYFKLKKKKNCGKEEELGQGNNMPLDLNFFVKSFVNLLEHWA